MKELQGNRKGPSLIPRKIARELNLFRRTIATDCKGPLQFPHKTLFPTLRTVQSFIKDSGGIPCNFLCNSLFLAFEKFGISSKKIWSQIAQLIKIFSV